MSQRSSQEQRLLCIMLWYCESVTKNGGFYQYGFGKICGTFLLGLLCQKKRMEKQNKKTFVLPLQTYSTLAANTVYVN